MKTKERVSISLGKAELIGLDKVVEITGLSRSRVINTMIQKCIGIDNPMVSSIDKAAEKMGLRND